MKNINRWENLSVARRCLMPPHPEGEDVSIAGAFLPCKVALHGLDDADLDDEAREGAAIIRRAMDTAGLSDPTRIGTFRVKARLMTEDERREFSGAVDELADWFKRRTHR